MTQVGIRFRGRAVVLTAGTFLDGTIHVGLDNYAAGRAGDPPALSLSARLKELKLPQGRLKTGTPPRLDGRTIDFSQCEEQPGDLRPSAVPVFSFMGEAGMHPRQVPCWITHTNERTHEIIRSGFDRSPMFTGKIEGVGPRYCPSVEDKINRFADKDSHQIFLEPEGLTTNEFYPNGISTSLPFDVQYQLVRSMPGLENAHILRPGLCDRVRLLRSARAEEQLRDPADRAACSSPARSTAPPATRRRRPRACSPASTPRCSARAGTPGAAPRRGLPRRAGGRPDHQGRDRAVPHVHQPGRVPAAAARGQRRHAPDRGRPPDWAWWTTRAGRPSTASAMLFHVKQSGCGRPGSTRAILPAAESERVLGKAIEHEYNLADLLRRPGRELCRR